MKELIIKTIADQLRVDKEKVVPTASLVNNLGADSLDIVELAMELEEVFDLATLSLGDGWVTVQDVITSVEIAVDREEAV